MLSRRTINVSGVSSRCRRHVPDVQLRWRIFSNFHCLRDCPHSRELWLRLGALSWRNFQSQNLEGWISSLARGPRSTMLLVGIWGIWKWRNNMCLGDPKWTVEDTWRRLCHEHDMVYQCLAAGSGLEDDELLVPRWLPPQGGFVKLNVDGSFNEEKQDMGRGGVFRDEQGKWLLGFAGAETGGNALEAEAVALRDGLPLAWDRGWRRVQCEVDCAGLLDVLHRQDRNGVFVVADQIQNLLERSWDVSLSRIPRDCNAVADYLARIVARSFNHSFWVIDVPSFELETLLLRDCLAL